MIEFTVILKKAWQFVKIGVLANFIIKKLKSKHFSLLTDFFEGTRENILQLFRALVIPQINRKLFEN